MKYSIMIPALAAMLALGGAAMADGGKGREARIAQFKESISALPEEKRALVEETFAAGRKAREESRERTKAKYEELRTLLAAPEFDREAYLNKSAELRAMYAEAGKARAERMADLASKLTVEERKILAEAMAKKHGKHGKRHGHDDDGEARE